MEFFAQIVAREDQRPAGVLLLDVAEQIGREADLRFDFFLAIAKVVVGNQRDDHAVFIAAGDFERLTVVVSFVGRFPAHALLFLSAGRLADVRQSELALRDRRQMRC